MPVGRPRWRELGRPEGAVRLDKQSNADPQVQKIAPGREYGPVHVHGGIVTTQRRSRNSSGTRESGRGGRRRRECEIAGDAQPPLSSAISSPTVSASAGCRQQRLRHPRNVRYRYEISRVEMLVDQDLLCLSGASIGGCLGPVATYSSSTTKPVKEHYLSQKLDQLNLHMDGFGQLQ
ncbi:hypothetical protein GWI33_013732 [Rhynchophorus ferrugineus]|uniref:Uncharacterized protein n=1 Tax=Rhynchophorus ferrugineus TaxID=354439 RepID=A0A834MBB7_RHYFE|nr:hypothetical protein GWI33_013732 [Rhynchophorus ferrugineus]